MPDQFPPDVVACLWDVDPTSVDPERHARFLIERAIEEGTGEAVRWVRTRYGDAQIAEVVRSSRRISPRTRAYWQLVLDLQEETCIPKPLEPASATHWPY